MASKASQADLEFGDEYELVAAEVFALKKWPGSKVVKNPKRSHIDHSIIRDGRLVAHMEVKRRRCASTEYPDTLVNLEKHDAGRFSKKFFRVRTICLLIFTDRVGTFFLDETPDGKKWVQRKDRDGAGCEHALYSIERLKWQDGLLEAIEEAAKGLKTQKNED